MRPAQPCPPARRTSRAIPRLRPSPRRVRAAAPEPHCGDGLRRVGPAEPDGSLTMHVTRRGFAGGALVLALSARLGGKAFAQTPLGFAAALAAIWAYGEAHRAFF